ncbi:MAG: roadblock/LC7 domain-containing protein [Nannocystaceae bacterium]|nr:roadblock/LC7 domain-containing protein [Myxococcales bacterium]
MIIRTLPITMPDVEVALVVDEGGGLLASSRSEPGATRDLIAQTIELVDRSEHAAKSLSRGELETVLIRDSDGFTILARATSAIVIVVTPSTVDLEQALLDLQRIVRLVERLRRSAHWLAPRGQERRIGASRPQTHLSLV